MERKMKVKIKKPSPVLREFIDSYWSLESDPKPGSFMTERVIPNGTSQMIFHYGNPFINKIGAKEISQKRLIVCGQKKVFSDVTAPTGSGMIGVVFKPFGLRPFLHVPVCEITDQEIPLADLIDKSANELEDQLTNCSSFDDRIEIVESFLLKRLFLPCRYNWGIAKESINQIKTSRGDLSVRSLSSYFNISIRSLERIFAAFIGISPIFFIRLCRFQKAMALVQSRREDNLTSIAFNCGYYDQSHFINEFKVFLGMNPSDFITQRCTQAQSQPLIT